MSALATMGIGLKASEAQAAVDLRPVEAYPIYHHIFGNRAVGQVTWRKPECISYTMPTRASFKGDEPLSYEKMEAEIQTAILAETVTDLTLEWIREVRAASPVVATFDQHKLMEPRAFVGDVYSALGMMIRSAARDNRWLNTAIMSPTALTILQAATMSAISRRADDESDPPFTFGPKLVGYLPVDEKRKLQILMDEYGSEDAPVLLGHVADLPEERAAQIVRTRIYEVMFGTYPSQSHLKGWKRIDINDKSLSFL